MKAEEYLEVLKITRRLKDATRHSYTSLGRHESVAEHSWQLAMMAFFLKDEFKDSDMDKVLKMCLIHDIGEAFTGDIPTFDKCADDETAEEALLYDWVTKLPGEYSEEMKALYKEMSEMQTEEARIYKALDGLEAVIQHNDADLNTWIDLEYSLNLTYADDKVAFSEYLKKLRSLVREETEKKITESQH